MRPRPCSTRVLFVCTGLGVINRGIESFFRESFDWFQHDSRLAVRLLKGAGPPVDNQERAVWHLPRTLNAARLIGALFGRDAYAVEQWTSIFSVVREIRRFRPQVIFYSDANLGFLLYRLRCRVPASFRLLFSNGGPVSAPFVRTDYVQQVAPCYFDEALAAGEPTAKHFLVPYGIRMTGRPQRDSGHARLQARRALRIEPNRKVLLSVGWISSRHKRMDCLIRAVAALPSPRPLLVLLGALDRQSRQIQELGLRLLGPDGLLVRSVPYEQVFPYYHAADCFVLASLQEGFGRVYLEALMHGLPVVAHDNPVTRFVLGPHGTLADLRSTEALTCALSRELAQVPNHDSARARWNWVRDKFSWQTLNDRYVDMFTRCAQA